MKMPRICTQHCISQRAPVPKQEGQTRHNRLVKLARRLWPDEPRNLGKEPLIFGVTFDALSSSTNDLNVEA